MSNPYESPQSRPAYGTPGWYYVFYRIYGPVWWCGTIIIVLSWQEVIPKNIAWVGFVMAGLSALGSYVLPRLAGVKEEEWIMLTSQMVASHDHNYRQAMQRFAAGDGLLYDDYGFIFRPPGDVVCAMISSQPPAEVTEASARDDAGRARAAFDLLVQKSPEFAQAVAERALRITIMTNFMPNSREICSVLGDEVVWPDRR